MQFQSNDSTTPATLFEPQLFTIDQAADQRRPRLSSQPELRLMLAVIEEAVVTYRRFAFPRDGLGRRRFEEVERWLQSPDTSWIYSFESICDALGLAPDALREALGAWRSRRARMGGTAERTRRWRRVAGQRRSILR